MRLRPHLYEVKHRYQKGRNIAIVPNHTRINESKAVVGVKVYREAAELVNPFDYGYRGWNTVDLCEFRFSNSNDYCAK